MIDDDENHIADVDDDIDDDDDASYIDWSIDPLVVFFA